MLIVCNGAAKSGSTWLYNIVASLQEFQWPDKKYISQSNTKHPTIKEKYLESFLDEQAQSEQSFISKNHYGKQWHRDLLISHKNTRIIDMSRETKDVIVSSYYDYCRRHGYQGSFNAYYWGIGRIQVESLSRYHQVWDPEHPQIMVTSFESLKQDFDAEVARIGQFLGLTLTTEQIESIKNETSLDSLRKSYKDDKQYNTKKNAFFRKGEIGDWVNHFDEKMLKDYEKITQNGIGKFDFHYLRYRIAEKLKHKFERSFN